MASLQQEPTGVFHIVFRYERQRFKRSLDTKTESIALARLQEIEEAIRLLKDGRIQIPDNVSKDAFVLAGGRLDAIKPVKAVVNEQGKTQLTLKTLFDGFFDSLPEENLESNTLRTMHTHEKHFIRLLKAGFAVTDLTGNDLQKYVNARAKEATQYTRTGTTKGSSAKRRVSATTIKKEIASPGDGGACQLLRGPRISEKVQ